MDSKLLRICALACAAAAFTACDDDNDVSCDPAVYVPTCIVSGSNADKIEVCSSETNLVTVQACESGKICKNYATGAVCEPYVAGQNCGNGQLDAGEVCDGTLFAAGKDVCADGTKNVTCKADCSLDTSKCAGGEEKACGNGKLDEGEECDGTTMSESVNQCDIPSAVTCSEDCKFVGCTGSEPPSEGMECSDEGKSSCAKDVLYTCKNGRTVLTSCADYKAACAEFDLGGGRTYADCMYEEDKCGAASDAALQCLYDEYYDTFYLDKVGCFKDRLSDNVYRLEASLYLGEADTDYAVCTNDTPVCRQNDGAPSCTAALSDLDGQTCSNARQLICDDSDSSLIHYCNTSSVYKSYSCQQIEGKGSFCDSAKGEVYCYVACDKLGKTSRCIEDSGESYSVSTECVESESGKLVYFDDSEVGDDGQTYYVSTACAHGCDSNSGSCITYSADEGNACDPDSFVPRCDAGGTAVSCVQDGNGNYIVATDKCESGTECVINGGSAACLAPCEAVGDKSYTCTQELEWFWYVDVSVENVCTKVGDKLYSIPTENSESCAHGCDTEDNTCKILDAREGQVCDSSSDADECVNETTLLTCKSSYFSDKDTFAAYDCKSDYGASYVCANSKCLDTCTEVGAKKSKCSGLSSAQTVTYECKEIGGVKVWDDISAETCGDGCLADGTACAPYEKCDESFVEKCDGTVVKYCSNSVVKSLDCSSVSGYTCQTVDAENGHYADCFTEDEVCDTVGEKEPSCEDYGGNDAWGDRVCYANVVEGGDNYVVFVPKKYCSKGSSYGSCNDEGTACEEYETCDETYVESCDGNIVKYCSSGYVETFACEAADGETCQTISVNGAPYADCFTEKDVCDAVNTPVQYCGAYGYYMVEGVKGCFANTAADGKNYQAFIASDYCEKGCKDDKVCLESED